jgi:hypothetical protein
VGKGLRDGRRVGRGRAAGRLNKAPLSALVGDVTQGLLSWLSLFFFFTSSPNKANPSSFLFSGQIPLCFCCDHVLALGEDLGLVV